MVLALAADNPPPAVWSDAWWSTFTTSPAFAGITALLAAGLATWGALRKVKADKTIAANAATAAAAAAALVRQDAQDAAKAQAAAAVLGRENAVEDRDRAAWWAHYEWLDDRLPKMDPLDAVSVLDALALAAPDDVAAVVVGVACEGIPSAGNARGAGTVGPAGRWTVSTASDETPVTVEPTHRPLTADEDALFDDLDAKLAPGGEYRLAVAKREQARRDRDAEIRRLVGLDA